MLLVDNSFSSMFSHCPTCLKALHTPKAMPKTVIAKTGSQKFRSTVSDLRLLSHSLASDGGAIIICPISIPQ